MNVTIVKFAISNGTIATWNVVDVIRRSPETSYLQRFDILNENRNLLCRVFMSRLLIPRDDIKRV